MRSCHVRAGRTARRVARLSTRSTHGKLYIDLFITFDGVAQAPGGPDEDRDGGFPFGGWQAPHMDELVGESGTVGDPDG